jgi:putative phosphoesterase
MGVLLAVLFVLFVVLLFLADRAVKAVRRGQRRRDVNERLTVVVAEAQAKDAQRRAVAEVQEALTSVMPTIHEHDPRHVDLGASGASGPSPASGLRAPASGLRQDGGMRVVVLSDTHAPRRWRSCPPRVASSLRGADLILHAGDVCTAAVLDELTQYAPVVAVAGNNDGPDVTAWGAPEVAEFDVGGVAVAMLHDSGPTGGRLARLRRRFPEADLVVFGHSHIPLDQSADGFRIFNPGSPTDRRRQPAGTIGILDIDDAHLVSATIVPVT